MSDTERFIELIKDSSTTFLAAHEKPDGDACGAVCAMAWLVRFFGGSPVILMKEPPPKFGFLFDGFTVLTGTDESPNVFIALDCADERRLASNMGAFARSRRTVCVDHHATNAGFADLNFVAGDASSTCEVLYALFADKIDVTKEWAEKIYAGVLTDTNGFRNPCASPFTHRLTARLMETGFDFTDVYDKVLSGKSLKELLAVKTAFNNLEVTCGGKLISTLMTAAESAENALTAPDLDRVIDNYAFVDGVEIAAFYYERTDGIVKISLRSKRLNVSMFAARYGGGGHALAAGAGVKGDIKAISAQINRELAEYIENND